jgi:hypothetical protein
MPCSTGGLHPLSQCIAKCRRMFVPLSYKIMFISYIYVQHDWPCTIYISQVPIGDRSKRKYTYRLISRRVSKGVTYAFNFNMGQAYTC